MRAVAVGFALVMTGLSNLAARAAFANKPVTAHVAPPVVHEVVPLHVGIVIDRPREGDRVATFAVAAPRAVKPKTTMVAAPVDFRAAVAHELVALPICRKPGGPVGPGRAQVTFEPSGSVDVVLAEPYANTASGACVARRIIAAAQPFDGPPITLALRFEL